MKYFISDILQRIKVLIPEMFEHLSDLKTFDHDIIQE